MLVHTLVLSACRKLNSGGTKINTEDASLFKVRLREMSPVVF
jgi:hypothetical protein